MRLPRGSLWWVVGLACLGPMAITWMLSGASRLHPASVLLGAGVLVAVPLIVRAMVAFMGWDRLARECPCEGSRRGGPWDGWLTSVALKQSFARLNNCIRWRSDDDGLTLGLEPPFNVFTPMVHVPWARVRRFERHSRYDDVIELVIDDGRGIRLYVSEELVERQLAARAAHTLKPD